jgi:plasmid stability protein
MPAVTVRNLSEATHRALKLRAAQHGCSTEAEIRAILDAAVLPESRTRVGSALQAFSQPFKGLSLDPVRDRKPIEPASFE